jgi:hypothetical protein
MVLGMGGSCEGADGVEPAQGGFERRCTEADAREAEDLG